MFRSPLPVMLLITGCLVVNPVMAVDDQQWFSDPARFENSFRCINTHSQTGKQTIRYIIVDYPQGAPLPCSVEYEKPTEAKPVQSLWRSANTQGYCEEKATGLAEKLTGFGWDCGLADNQVSGIALPIKINEKNQKTVPVVKPAASELELDFVGPVISLQKKNSTPIKGQPYTLSAIVTDDVGVNKVHLFYQTNDEPYTSLYMDRENNSDRYAATLAKSATESGSIRYYIMAEDMSGNTVLHGNSISPRALDFIVETSARVNSQPESDDQELVTTQSYIRDKGDAEQALWQKAELSHAVADYEYYLKTYPFGRYTSLAQARLKYLQSREDDTAGDVQKSKVRTAKPLW